MTIQLTPTAQDHLAAGLYPVLDSAERSADTTIIGWARDADQATSVLIGNLSEGWVLSSVQEVTREFRRSPTSLTEVLPAFIGIEAEGRN
jgi:hypothetical protein